MKALAERLCERPHASLAIEIEPIDETNPHGLSEHAKPVGDPLRERWTIPMRSRVPFAAAVGYRLPMPPLRGDTLSASAERLPTPTYDRSHLTVGVVHLGVGGFHRAHQAMYHDRLMTQGKSLDWAISGVGVMPSDRRMKEVLDAQDGLYTLVLKHSDGTYQPRVIGAITEYLFAPDDPGYVGTLGLVFEPMATTLEALVDGLDDDTLVALDPNCRPTTIDDPAAYRGRLERLLRHTDVVKVSEEDLAWLDRGTSLLDAARALLVRDGALALLTLGADGSRVVTGTDVFEVDACRVDTVDTIGAGDSFMGALLADWSSRGLGRGDLAREEELVEAVRFASRVAAITCSRSGADPPRRAELDISPVPKDGEELV